jgi:hypothetical protein
MPRVYKKVARKDYPQFGITKGSTYWECKFRSPGARSGYLVKFSSPPTRAQLTKSPYLQTLYGLDEDISSASDGSDFEAIAASVREAGEECQSSLENMPEGLQQGSTGELLQARYDACEAAADEIEAIGQKLDERLGEIDDAETAWDADSEGDEQASLAAEFGEDPDWEALREEARGEARDEASSQVDEAAGAG